APSAAGAPRWFTGAPSRRALSVRVESVADTVLHRPVFGASEAVRSRIHRIGAATACDAASARDPCPAPEVERDGAEPSGPVLPCRFGRVGRMITAPGRSGGHEGSQHLGSTGGDAFGGRM